MNNWLTVEEVCEWLHISKDTLKMLRKEGLPYIKFKNIYRFDKKAVIEWRKGVKRNIAKAY